MKVFIRAVYVSSLMAIQLRSEINRLDLLSCVHSILKLQQHLFAAAVMENNNTNGLFYGNFYFVKLLGSLLWSKKQYTL